MKQGRPKVLKLPPPDRTGFFGFMRALFTRRFQQHATEGRGRVLHTRKKGPGRRGSRRHNPPGSKLWKVVSRAHKR